MNDMTKWPGKVLGVAWIRDSSVPPGIPALGRLKCPCGKAPKSAFRPEQGNVVCKCGTVYTWNGWIVEKVQK